MENKSYLCNVKKLQCLMKEAKLKTISGNDNVCIYSICFDGSDESEFEKFLNKFKDNARYNKAFNIILQAISKCMADGVLERFFRREGKQSDSVAGLAIDSQRLRLYCLRMSEQILILGNGGIKNKRTYEEIPELMGYVIDLQLFEKALKEAQRSGRVTIERNMITGIESATFTI